MAGQLCGGPEAPNPPEESSSLPVDRDFGLPELSEAPADAEVVQWAGGDYGRLEGVSWTNEIVAAAFHIYVNVLCASLLFMNVVVFQGLFLVSQSSFSPAANIVGMF